MECHFCQRNIKEIDFKEADLLKKFISGTSKVRSRERTGVCAKHQRKLAKAIKRARFLGLLAYTRK